MNDMSHTQKRQRGGAMVEFALGISLFLLLVFGVIEFAFAVFQWSRVVDATREGARAAIVNDMACQTLDDLIAECNPITCTGNQIAEDSPILAAMNRRKLGVSRDRVSVTYSCSTAGSEDRLIPIPQVTVEIPAWQHTFLMSGLTLGRQDLWTVTLPPFATTRLGEDLYTVPEE